MNNAKRIVLSLSAFFILLCTSPITTADISSSDLLNVYIIPHSHCDPGWLLTFEEYLQRQVNDVLNSVMRELSNKPYRRFVWAEISFFQPWFDKQSKDIQNNVKQLVRNGQLEFIGGGWVQNDEANVHYDTIIEQISAGHDYILKHFGVRPRFAWQIDPFGYSSLTPILFSQMGYEALVINRIHYSLKDSFKQSKDMEFIWRGSPNTLGEKSDLFTHVLHTHYSAPSGYDWEEGAPSISSGNVANRADHLLSELHGRAQAYRTNHLLVTFGDDFKFRNAELQFSNMDQIIEHVNSNAQRYRARMQYATLSEYFTAVAAAGQSLAANAEDTNFHGWRVFRGDFFPYADNGGAYWTGYYTTRPSLKLMSRTAEAALRTAEIAYVVARGRRDGVIDKIQWDLLFQKLLQARRDISLVQHHDGITGTAKTYVGDDYRRRLLSATTNAESVLETLTPVIVARETPLRGNTDARVLTAEPKVLTFDGTKGATCHPLVLQNPLAWPSRYAVRVTVASSRVKVVDHHGNAVPSQLFPYWTDPAIDKDPSTTLFTLYFVAELPPIGWCTYYVMSRDGSNANDAPASYSLKTIGAGRNDAIDGELAIENSRYKMTFSAASGLPQTLIDKEGKDTIDCRLELFEYMNSGRGGAYISNTHGVTEFVPRNPVILHTKGQHVEELQVVMASRGMRQSTSMATFTARVFRFPGVEDFVEIVYGQPMAQHNKELVARWVTSMGSANVIDKNGATSGRQSDVKLVTSNSLESMQRESLKHIPNPNQPETQYFPCISTAFLQETDNTSDTFGRRLTFHVRHALGVASQSKGAIEFLLHRQSSQDDGRGLGEALSDPHAVDVVHWLAFATRGDFDGEDAGGMRHRRALRLSHPPRVLFTATPVSTPETWAAEAFTEIAPLSRAFPATVHLQGMKATDSATDDFLMRLVNIGEGPLAAPATVDLVDMFSTAWWRPLAAVPRRRSLTGNRDLIDTDDSRLRFQRAGGDVIWRTATEHRTHQSQNTEEEGVFISKAALEEAERLKKEKMRGSRSLKAVGDDEVATMEIPPLTFHAYVVRFAGTETDAASVKTPAEPSSVSVLRKDETPLESEQQQQQPPQQLPRGDTAVENPFRMENQQQGPMPQMPPGAAAHRPPLRTMPEPPATMSSETRNFVVVSTVCLVLVLYAYYKLRQRRAVKPPHLTV